MRGLKTWRDVIKAILGGEDVQYMFGDQYMDREKVPCIPINMLDDKTILEHRIKPKQSKLENTVKVLSDDDSLTIAYMSGYYDGKRPATPEGWQLVPKELSDEMKKAGCQVPLNKAARHNACYKAMLAAAPKFGEE